jgi:hypothetical protein
MVLRLILETAPLKTLKSVRGELVEPHLSQQNQMLTKSPFDKLRANGGFLEVAFFIIVIRCCFILYATCSVN